MKYFFTLSKHTFVKKKNRKKKDQYSYSGTLKPAIKILMILEKVRKKHLIAPKMELSLIHVCVGFVVGFYWLFEDV